MAAKWGDGIWTLPDPESTPDLLEHWRSEGGEGEVVFQALFSWARDDAAAMESVRKWKGAQPQEHFKDDWRVALRARLRCVGCVADSATQPTHPRQAAQGSGCVPAAVATVTGARLATIARASVSASIRRSVPAAIVAVPVIGSPLIVSVPSSTTHTCSWSAVWSGPMRPARISTVHTARSLVPVLGAASVCMTPLGVSCIW